MICKNCGAHFQDDLQDLHETIPEIYAAELKSQAKKVRKIVLIIIGIFAGLLVDGMRTYTVSEDSLLYALEDGRYGDLTESYHRNLVSDVKATDTMKECYAIARYYEAAIDYKLL